MAPNKPSWIDQVKEVDAEEAEVLWRLGVPVFPDWVPFVRVNKLPVVRAIEDEEDFNFCKRQVAEQNGFFYVRRGDDDKR